MAEQADKSGSDVKSASSWLADLPDVISKFWSTVAAPLLELALVIGLLSYVFDIERVKIPNNPNFILDEHGPIAANLEFYGLKTFLAPAVLIIILGIAKANFELLNLVGKLTPPNLQIDPLAMIRRHADHFQLLAIWEDRAYIADVKGLNAFIDLMVNMSDADIQRRVLFDLSRKLRDRIENYSFVANASKSISLQQIVLVLTLVVIMKYKIDYLRISVVLTIILSVFVIINVNIIRLSKEFARIKIEECYCFLQVSGNTIKDANDIEFFMKSGGLPGDVDPRLWTDEVAKRLDDRLRRIQNLSPTAREWLIK